MSGYSGAARIMFKQMGMFGDKVETFIASWAPDAAIQLSKEDLADLLREVSKKQAQYKQDLDPKRSDSLISKHSDIVAQLAIKKKAAGKVLELSKTPGAKLPSEESQNKLADEMEVLHKEAKKLEAMIANKKSHVDFLENVKQQRREALRSFDKEAADAKYELEMATLRKEQADIKVELSGLATKKGGSMAGLSAVRRAAKNMNAEADAAEDVAGVHDSAAASDDVMAEILKEAEHGPKGSALSRLEEASKS